MPSPEVAGIGIDIIEVPRIHRLLAHGDGRLGRVFTPAELSITGSRRDECLATVFAIKEAIFKALGRGWGQGMRWEDVSTSRDAEGCWAATLQGNAARRLASLGAEHISVSACVAGGHAIAQVYIWGT